MVQETTTGYEVPELSQTSNGPNGPKVPTVAVSGNSTKGPEKEKWQVSRFNVLASKEKIEVQQKIASILSNMRHPVAKRRFWGYKISSEKVNADLLQKVLGDKVDNSKSIESEEKIAKALLTVITNNVQNLEKITNSGATSDLVKESTQSILALCLVCNSSLLGVNLDRAVRGFLDRADAINKDLVSSAASDLSKKGASPAYASLGDLRDDTNEEYAVLDADRPVADFDELMQSVMQDTIRSADPLTKKEELELRSLLVTMMTKEDKLPQRATSEVNPLIVTEAVEEDLSDVQQGSNQSERNLILKEGEVGEANTDLPKVDSTAQSSDGELIVTPASTPREVETPSPRSSSESSDTNASGISEYSRELVFGVQEKITHFGGAHTGSINKRASKITGFVDSDNDKVLNEVFDILGTGLNKNFILTLTGTSDCGKKWQDTKTNKGDRSWVKELFTALEKDVEKDSDEGRAKSNIEKFLTRNLNDNAISQDRRDALSLIQGYFKSEATEVVTEQQPPSPALSKVAADAVSNPWLQSETTL
jgi:hypothetical protein